MAEGVGPDALARWFRAHAPQIERYAARRLGASAAQDVTAAVFTEAWASRHRFDPTRGSERAWLFGIATNVVAAHRRSERRRLRALARSPVESSTDGVLLDADDRLDAQADGPALARALLGLRAADRDLFWLSVSGELTYAEMAEVSGLPVGTVRSRLSRVRAHLRTALALPDEPDDEPGAV